MKKITGGMVSGFCFLALVGTVDANLIINGNFESGDLTGWTSSGSVDVVKGGLLDLQGMDNYYALLGGWDLSGKQKLSQEFSVAGVSQITISFDWAFDSIDFSCFNDDTFLAIAKQDDSVNYSITMLDLTSSELGSSYFYGIDAAWGAFSRTFSIAEWIDDTGDIIFALSEAKDCWWWGTDSIVGIDNVVIETVPAPVPEPTTVFFVGVGLVGMVCSRLKRKTKTS